MKLKWHEYFLGIAAIASLRSHDSQTKHGAVITDKDNRVLGIGYNGFPRNSQDELLPNTRPDKYPYIIHAEENAVNNCAVRPYYVGGGIAYVTGQCCSRCTRTLIQNGITKIVMGRKQSAMIDANDLAVFNQLVSCNKHKIEIEYFSLNLNRIILLLQEWHGCELQ